MKAWQPITPAEAQAGGVVYLLRLRFGGRLFRLATRTMHIEDEDGDSHVYQGRLRRVDYVDEVDIFSADTGRRSVPVEFTLPVDVPRLIAQGHALDQADAELSRVVIGRTEEARVVLLAGTLQESEVGTVDEPITATLVDEPMRSSGMWPPETYQINSLTWTNPAGNAVGRWYPTPFGKPGAIYDESGARRRPATRGYLVDTAGTATVPHALLVAGGAAYLSEVTIYNGDGEAIDVGTLQQMRDGLGQVVSVFEMDAALIGAPDYNFEFYVAPSPSATVGWGIYGDLATGLPMRGLGDVLSWALRRSGLRVDWGQVEAQRGRLNRFHVDGAVEERVNLWQWIVDNVLGTFPVWASGGPFGIRVGVLDPRDPPVFHLRIPRDGIREGPPTFDRSKISNAQAVRFALDRTSDLQVTTVQTPDVDASLERPVPSAYTAISRARYGRSGETVISSDLVSEQTTATQILLANARFRGMGVRGISYRCRRRVQGIQAGDVGRLTDSELGFDEVPVICRRVTPQEADVVVDLVHVVDPIRSPGS